MRVDVMIGVGFYFPAGIATAMTLIVLSVFRWIERTMPIEFYANLTVAFSRTASIPEEELRSIVEREGFVIANMNYGVTDSGLVFEYQMVIHTPDRSKTRNLAIALNTLSSMEWRMASSFSSSDRDKNFLVRFSVRVSSIAWKRILVMSALPSK